MWPGSKGKTFLGRQRKLSNIHCYKLFFRALMSQQQYKAFQGITVTEACFSKNLKAYRINNCSQVGDAGKYSRKVCRHIKKNLFSGTAQYDVHSGIYCS